MSTKATPAVVIDKCSNQAVVMFDYSALILGRALLPIVELVMLLRLRSCMIG